jgi:alkylation response protein AidB-like acyl-CoA dehydrogenase
MDLQLTPEQQDLRDVAAQALDRLAPLSVARAFLDGGGDASALRDWLRGLGWYGVGAEGDDTFGVGGLCLLAEQVGRHAAPTLLVDSAVCSRAAGQADGSDELIAKLSGGELACALAVLERDGSWDASSLSAQAVRGPDGAYSVSATKLGVHHAESADLIAVVSRCEEGVGLFFVDPRAEGVTIDPVAAFDPASAPGDVVFDRAPAAAVVTADGAAVQALAIGAVATAAEGIGAASAALDLAIAYARERVQYKREIARFQALAHLMAELHVQRETAWSTVLFAAATIDEDQERLPETVSIAKAHAARAAKIVVEGALQVLGGIGFTWEHDHHLLHRRVLECERRFGDAAHHERRLGTLLSRRAAPGISY